MSRIAKGLANSAPTGTGANGVQAVSVPAGGFITTTLKFNSIPVTVGNTTGASIGSKKIFDFPAGRITIVDGSSNLQFVWTGEDIVATGSGDYSLGTTATAEATLNSTEVNIQASTAMLDPFVGGVGTGSGAFAALARHDGSATAIDMYLNMIIDDADVSDAASDTVLVSGTIIFAWIWAGDY